MEKSEENTKNSSNVELNFEFSLNSNGNSSPSSSGISQESVASHVTQFEIQQQPHIPGRISQERLRDLLHRKPRASTRVDGPNGKKTEGLFLSCKIRDNMKIVCLCHGNLLSPAEFVEHAGGGDVENPLSHIIIDDCESLNLFIAMALDREMY